MAENPLDGPSDDGTYDADGVDRSLIRWMLSLTPTERLRVAASASALRDSIKRPSDGAR